MKVKEIINIEQFKKYMTKYFSIRKYNDVPEVVLNGTESDSKKYNSPD